MGSAPEGESGILFPGLRERECAMQTCLMARCPDAQVMLGKALRFQSLDIEKQCMNGVSPAA